MVLGLFLALLRSVLEGGSLHPKRLSEGSHQLRLVRTVPNFMHIVLMLRCGINMGCQICYFGEALCVKCGVR